MDDERFDSLTRSLGTRRTVLGGLLAGLTVAVGLVAPAGVAAHNPIPGCKKIKDPEQKRKCLERAKKHNRTHCKPQPTHITCAGGCGPTKDNCKKKTIQCPCPAGRICLPNRSCAKSCSGFCSGLASCVCNVTNDGRVCLVEESECAEASNLLLCETTADCPSGYVCDVPRSCFTSPRRCFPLCG